MADNTRSLDARFQANSSEFQRRMNDFEEREQRRMNDFEERINAVMDARFERLKKYLKLKELDINEGCESSSRSSPFCLHRRSYERAPAKGWARVEEESSAAEGAKSHNQSQESSFEEPESNHPLFLVGFAGKDGRISEGANSASPIQEHSGVHQVFDVNPEPDRSRVAVAVMTNDTATPSPLLPVHTTPSEIKTDEGIMFESDLYLYCDGEDDTKTGDNDDDVVPFPPSSPIAVVAAVFQPQTQEKFEAEAAKSEALAKLDTSTDDVNDVRFYSLERREPDDNDESDVGFDSPTAPLEEVGTTAMLDRFTRPWDPGRESVHQLLDEGHAWGYFSFDAHNVPVPHASFQRVGKNGAFVEFSNSIISWVALATAFKGGTNFLLCHSQNSAMFGTARNRLHILNFSNGNEYSEIVKARINCDDVDLECVWLKRKRAYAVIDFSIISGDCYANFVLLAAVYGDELNPCAAVAPTKFRSAGLQALESYKSLDLELEQSQARVISLEYIQSTLEIRSAFELVEKAKSESCKKVAELEAKLTAARADAERLKETLIGKETQLKNITEENKELFLKVGRAQTESILEDLKASLMDKETELQSVMEENKMLKLEMKNRELERSKLNNEVVAVEEAARATEQEALTKLNYLTEEADKNNRKAARVTEHLDALITFLEFTCFCCLHFFGFAHH